ncbi:hypothetical protein BIFCAT_01853 [Bifidobacterium catenulatum DSM 16992 = JCM 1194 = LMG 11043]|uniref:Uncharacterized protein n=1 Tax=Bifidobacterium catenulatum DSM 16992 = JCM 1194 = LMG 11043 TaxID=566552 RepID=B6XWZ0_9BIFI|nr:hypothetical protein BIFCAT_01853 [Bifidobacterium catenulatum DSM 16992 = JCM 1194 = LMG 11043]
MDTMSNIDSLAQDQPEKRLHAGIRKTDAPTIVVGASDRPSSQ